VASGESEGGGRSWEAFSGRTSKRTLFAHFGVRDHALFVLVVAVRARARVILEVKFVDDKNYITKQPRIACENISLEHAREVIVNGEWFVCSSLASAVGLSGP